MISRRGKQESDEEDSDDDSTSCGEQLSALPSYLRKNYKLESFLRQFDAVESKRVRGSRYLAIVLTTLFSSYIS